MKLHHVFLSALLVSAVFVPQAIARGSDDGENNPKPHFNDPGGHSPSRIVSQPGGSPYYQPPSSQVLSSDSNPAGSSKQSQ